MENQARKFSLSTVSDSTVNSSVVNQLVTKYLASSSQHFDDENYIRDVNAAQTKLKIEGSSGIRVGDVINQHFYYPDKKMARGRVSSIKSFQDNIFKEVKKAKKNAINLKLSRKKIIIGLTSIVIISVAVGLLTYFLTPDNNPEVTTTALDLDSTTPEITLPETDSTTTSSTTTETTTQSTTTTTQSTSTTSALMDSTSTISNSTQSTSTTESTSTISTSSQSTTTLSFDELLVSRSEWTSDPIDGSIKLLADSPIKRIIVGQTDDNVSCFNKVECILKVKKIRDNFSNMLDIPWNFLVGGDGKVYEGRGFRHEGEHTINWNATDYNDIGIGIGFIGNFRTVEPSMEMQNGFDQFLIKSVENGLLNSSYKIFFQDQLSYKQFEGLKLMDALRGLMGGKIYELQRIYKREEWEAVAVFLNRMENPLQRVILSHAVVALYGLYHWPCITEINCANMTRILQSYALNTGMSDIHYNFLIGGNEDYSLVLEGRGFTNTGAHTSSRNTGSLGIGLLGHFDNFEPGSALMNALRLFIDEAAALGKLTEDYKIHFYKDFRGGTSPGVYVTNIVQNWPRYAVPAK